MIGLAAVTVLVAVALFTAEDLLNAFTSPTLGWLTVAFLLTASIFTYDKRIIQYRKMGALPPETPDSPAWTGIFAWAEIGLKIALLVINWQFGALLYAFGFVLASLGLLERVGNLIMSPLLGIKLPSYALGWYAYSGTVIQDIALAVERREYIFRTVATAAAYLGITVLLNAVRKDAASVFLWSLIAIQLLLYSSIFIFAAIRAKECGFAVSWLLVVLAILGRVNDFELLIIPIVVVASSLIYVRPTLRMRVAEYYESHPDRTSE